MVWDRRSRTRPVGDQKIDLGFGLGLARCGHGLGLGLGLARCGHGLGLGLAGLHGVVL